MTKQAGFKRVVRQRARSTGQRYTEALADLKIANRQAFARTRPVDPSAVASHLESHYGTRITSLAPIDDDPVTRPRGSWPGHYPSTLLVNRADGHPWVARVFSSTADRLDRVQGDLEILRFLARHNFPAERPVGDESVSVFDGSGVIVTEFVEGGRPTDAQGRSESTEVFHELGNLLGRLHRLPAAGGAVGRAGGAEETDGGFHVGRPAQDLAAAMSFLVDVEDAVAPEQRAGFDSLRDEVERADDAEGLPEALTHSNYHVWAALGAPGNLVITGWAGAGRGPRLPALAWLLTTAAEGHDRLVDAVMHGYSEHIQLTDQELERLPGVLSIRPLWLACLDYRQSVRSGRVMDLAAGWAAWHSANAERVAAQVRTAAASFGPKG